ncbi:MAG: 50S ribosomal protein L18Ae [Thermoprotei archaeon]
MAKEPQVSVYQVVGKFSDGFYIHQFKKFLIAKNEARAVERILSEIGSKHHVKRSDITIGSVSKITNYDEIDDPLIKKMIQNERRKGRVSALE